MKGVNKLAVALVFGLTFGSTMQLHAGNEQRVGQAGATQLQINPWARTTGMAGANTASITGLEATFSNVAGLAFTNNTELIFSRSNYLTYGDNQSVSNINSFGFAQKMGESSVLGLSIMSMGFGDIDITTVNIPEGGIGTYSPSLTNIAVSYAKEFSNSIYGGVTVRMISEKIYNLNTSGACFDAGIQYVTGASDHVKFGVSLKSIGSRMLYGGDGLSFRGNADEGDYFLTVAQRSNDFELPSLLNIGLAYDFAMLPENHRISTAGTFTSNSFQKDQFRVGLEYAFREMVMLRCGYVYQDGFGIEDGSVTEATLSGPSSGITIELPMGNSTFGIDYSYRDSQVFRGTHSLGVRIGL